MTLFLSRNIFWLEIAVVANSDIETAAHKSDILRTSEERSCLCLKNW